MLRILENIDFLKKYFSLMTGKSNKYKQQDKVMEEEKSSDDVKLTFGNSSNLANQVSVRNTPPSKS